MGRARAKESAFSHVSRIALKVRGAFLRTDGGGELLSEETGHFDRCGGCEGGDGEV
jgi:hypothetical protein